MISNGYLSLLEKYDEILKEVAKSCVVGRHLEVFCVGEEMDNSIQGFKYCVFKRNSQEISI